MIVADETRQKSVAFKLMRKLTARERLFELAAATVRFSRGDPRLEALKAYLQAWAAQSEPVTLVAGAPGQVSYADLMRGTPSWEVDDDHRVDASIRKAIDEAIYEITARFPLARSCLMVRYLNLAGPAVYRHGRLHHLTRNEIEDVADAAEVALVPVVVRRGVVL